MLNLKPDVLQGLASNRNVPHLRDTITELDLVGELLVPGNGRVPVVGHHPLIDTELE
jgi:hypothetical protein